MYKCKKCGYEKTFVERIRQKIDGNEKGLGCEY